MRAAPTPSIVATISRGIAMVFKAVGLAPYGRVSALTSGAVWRIMRSRQQRYAKIAA
jgi:hypothetical protein